jgi:hypothetical protein
VIGLTIVEYRNRGDKTLEACVYDVFGGCYEQSTWNGDDERTYRSIAVSVGEGWNVSW